MKELRNVIDESDIILEVLDARDPDGCRCRELEAEAQGSGKGKKIILVLNKIDLVPMPVVEAWKKRLEREYACVLFKANTQNQKDNLGSRKLYSNSLHKNPDVAFHLIDSSKAVGPDKLLELIKNYSKVEGTKTGVTVGVIGYPNVGKSSLINSMKKRRAVGVSGTAGFTTNLQTVEIDKMVKIVDSPGVILSNENETALVLRNTVNAADVKDPITPISEILNRISKEQALKLYKIADFKNATQFLVNIAQMRGKFKKGGVADIEGAARLVIEDWNTGRVNHFVPPPGFDPSILIGVRGEMEEEVDAMDDSVQMGAMVTEHDAGANQMEVDN
jgi:nuclear GTP-binding protein